MKEMIIEFFWYLCAICLLIWVALYQYLIRKMESISPEHFKKAGKPSKLWSDHRTLAFIFYILSRKYESFPDEKTVNFFWLARMTLIIWFVGFLAFIFVSVQ